MARGLGIELDSDSVRALALEGGKRPRIVAFAEQHIDSDEKRPWVDRAREAIRAAVADAGGPRGRIAASIDSGDAILRELQLPFTNDDQIRKTVRYELEQHIHNYAIEDLVVDFVKTASSAKGSQILVAAIPKTLIEERLKLFESAGADPAVVDLDALALFNALVEAGAVGDDAPILAMYGGSRFTKFLLIENRRPRAVRTLRYSATAAEPAPSVDLPEADRVEAGPESEPLIVVDSSAPVDILAIEAGRFLMASAASGPPSRILITGRLDLEAVAGPLKEATGADAEYVDLHSRFGPVPASAQGMDRRLPVALGLALKALERDATATDFRRDEFSYSKKFENVKSSALVMVSLVAMLLALVGLHLYFKGTDLKRDTELVLSYQAQVVADAVNHDPTKIPQELKDDPTKALEYMKKVVADADRKLGTGVHPIEHSSLNLIGRIYKTLEQFHRQNGSRPMGGEPFYILVDAVNATQDPSRSGYVQITINGQSSNTELAEAFRAALLKAEPFKEGWTIEAQQYTAIKDNMGFSFTIKKGKG